MKLLECEATFEATPAAVWQVWTDVASWPEWDASKEIARLDGDFEVGSPGWAKQRGNLGGLFMITLIEPGQRFVTECPLPAPARSSSTTGSRRWSAGGSGWSRAWRYWAASPRCSGW